jgi:hypothetical protein
LQKRLHFKQTESIQSRLLAFASDVRAQAETLSPGSERDELLKKARVADAALHLNQWAYSPGLQSPK